jgi:hypothetical protein
MFLKETGKLNIFLFWDLNAKLSLGNIEMNQRSKSGQAVVEYMLILVVSVTLILSLASVIFTPFQVFLNQFLGEYVSCLLESGELPPMGASPLKAKGPACPLPKFKGGNPVSIPGGPTGIYGGSEGSDGSGSNSGSSKSDGSDKDSANADGSDSDRGKGSRGGRGGSSSSSFMGNRPTAGDGAGAEGLSKSREIPIAGVEGGGPGNFNGNKFANIALGSSERKTKAVALDGMTDEQKKSLKQTERGGQVKIATAEGFAAKEKKTTLKPPERKAASTVEEEETGFQFGGLIRILFIIAIIVIIISLIGGQVAQMMKSWES